MHKLVLTLLVVVLSITVVVEGRDFIFVSNATDADWNIAANWNFKSIPTIEDDVVINIPGTVYLYINDPPGFARTVSLRSELVVFSGLTTQGIKGSSIEASVLLFGKSSTLGIVTVQTFDVTREGAANVTRLDVNDLFVEGVLHLGASSTVERYFFFNGNGTVNSTATTSLRASDIVSDSFFLGNGLHKSVVTNALLRRQAVKDQNNKVSFGKLETELHYQAVISGSVATASGIQLSARYLRSYGASEAIYFTHGASLTVGYL